MSHESSIQQIRILLEKENFVVQDTVRPHLWTKVICQKTLAETLQSSIADSYQQWELRWKKQFSEQKANTIIPTVNEESHENNDNDLSKDQRDTHATTEPAASTSDVQGQLANPPSQQREEWLQEQSEILAKRIVSAGNGNDLQSCQEALLSLLENHYDTGEKNNNMEEGTEAQESQPEWMDPLLPPVACAILSAGVPKVAAAVLLSQIIPSFMPILALTAKEREKAAGVLHRQFYLLACYHLPLLVLHLDKYMPNWYKWPPHGQLPQSWLVSHLAGETDGAYMTPQRLLSLWDLVLTSSNNSLRFFLVMAILDNHAERLLLLTDDDLKEEFRKVVTFTADSADNLTQGVAQDNLSPQGADAWVREWSDKALSMWEETPFSVSLKLKCLEDEAVNDALMRRQQEKEERLRLKAEAEARAQQEALEAERERKADEARNRLTRARLVAFYRQYNPGRENNIDKILESYKGRYDVLDMKLKQKYGVGFNPALKPKEIVVNKSSTNILASMNTGFGGARRFVKRPDDQEAIAEMKAPEFTAVRVSASEVLPIICWSKEANQAKLHKLKKSSKLENEARDPLKFYLVDSRPEASAQEQGRFPTSVSLSPEKLVDLSTLKEQEEMFESLRGSVHICIMGEGYSALPDLYGHKMTGALAQFIREDASRNNECSQFFLSRGFPFAGIMDGGFASAHAWLHREGPKHHLRAQNVLTDYSPEVSLFGLFETLHRASGREKAQRSIQSLFDSSMAAITKNSMRLETFTSELTSGSKTEDQTQQKNGQKNAVQRFFGGNREGSSHEKQDTADSAGPPVPFRNPFVRRRESKAASLSAQELPSNDLLVESVEFDGSDKPMPAKSPEQAPQIQSESTGPTVVEARADDKPKSNPFSGLGVALNSSLKANIKTPSPSPQQLAPVKGIPKNPFARFGGGGNKAGDKGPGMVNHLAGLNQFRKNTLSRMMTPGKESLDGSAGTPTESAPPTQALPQRSNAANGPAAALNDPEAKQASNESDTTSGDSDANSSFAPAVDNGPAAEEKTPTIAKV